MKDLIKYIYNIEIEEEKIYNSGENFEFKINNSLFLLCLAVRNEKELSEIYQIISELKSRKIPVHTLVLNRENKLISKIYDQNYILLKIENNEQKEINILDIMNFQESLLISKNKKHLYRNNWGELWSKKIDFFEYQIHELGKNKKIILNSFSYYIGLAENAIEYVNNTNKKFQITTEESISLSHKRIEFPNLAKNYFNPLQFIFDLQVRDIAEYIKSAFFKSQDDAWIELKAFINRKKRSAYEYQMFFARILYPSYYFDVYENVMNNKEKEESLLKYIEKVNDYEIFLKNVYREIRKIHLIDEIKWLNN